MILTCAAGVRPWCKNMTNVNAKSSLISHMAMMRPKLGIVAKLEWFSIEIVVSAEGVGLGILSVQREGGATLSNFMLFNSADACPVPSWPDTDTHCHRWKLREGFVWNRKNSLTEVSQERKRKWGSIVSRWMEKLSAFREVFSPHHHSEEDQVFPAYLRTLSVRCNSFGKHWKPQTACLSSRLKVGV